MLNDILGQILSLIHISVRRIAGVKDAKQYTIPVESALEAVRNGENPELTTRQKHTRECFVCLLYTSARH